jgi:hypothetical protein
MEEKVQPQAVEHSSHRELGARDDYEAALKAWEDQKWEMKKAAYEVNKQELYREYLYSMDKVDKIESEGVQIAVDDAHTWYNAEEATWDQLEAETAAAQKAYVDQETAAAGPDAGKKLDAELDINAATNKKEWEGILFKYKEERARKSAYHVVTAKRNVEEANEEAEKVRLQEYVDMMIDAEIKAHTEETNALQEVSKATKKQDIAQEILDGNYYLYDVDSPVYQAKVSEFNARVSRTIKLKLRKWARDNNCHCLGNSWELGVEFRKFHHEVAD